MTVMAGCCAVPMCVSVTVRLGPGRAQTNGGVRSRSRLRRASWLHRRDKKRCDCQKKNTQDVFHGNSPKTGDSPQGY
jgi:hypothetical protein